MELTEEVLKGTGEEGEAVAIAAAETKDREMVERIKTNYPELFVEFNRVKKLKVDFETEKYDEDLHWLQMEMIYGREWKWNGLQLDIEDYSKEEKQIISSVASSYYEALEKELWAGKRANVNITELISLIEKAGVKTVERESVIYWATINSVGISTRVYALDHPWNELWEDEQTYFPEELQY